MPSAQAGAETTITLPCKGELAKTVTTPHYLLGVYYDGKLEKAVLVLLSESGEKLVEVPDPIGHRPYFLTDESIEELKAKMATEDSVLGFEEVQKVDPLTMRTIRAVKVITKDPLAVKKLRGKVRVAWEAKIKYHVNYIFDQGLIPGMKYTITNSGGVPKISLIEPTIPDSLLKTIEKIFEKEPSEVKNTAKFFALLFEEAPPKALRLSLDIEVFTPFKGRVPSARLAEYPVISVSVVDKRGFKKVFMLARPFKNSFTYAINSSDYPVDAVIEIYDSEKTLILDVYNTISKYPVVVTYNGDNFDLLYLYMRSLKLGIPRSIIPIRVREGMIGLETSVHLDLYKFFSNRAIKNYAFGGKYQEDKLDAVAGALLGMVKIGFEETISEISAGLLAAYNLRDAEITLKLTLFEEELVWKLLVLLARVSKTSLEEVCRRQISSWIQNLFFWEHRKRGYLIPNKEDIASRVKSYTKAVIEGKKYAGALVIEPPRGVFFNVAVLDIASLYPSIIKNYNLSYETVDVEWCSKKISVRDETGAEIHKVCVDKVGLTALITGILRDFRVGIYKKRAKDKTLTPEQRAWYDVVQRALKVFINASYGVFGDEKFALYSPVVAESVTALGRVTFKHIVCKASEMGVKPLYGDTDSIFVWAYTKEHLDLLQQWTQQTLGLDVELDKEFTFTVFTGLKKNYLGRTTSGEIEIKGLMAKKRNTPEFIKDLFSTITEKLSKIETPNDFSEFIEWLEKTLKYYYTGLKRKEITLDQLSIKTTLSKDPLEYVKSVPFHVKAALQLRSHNIDVREGDVVLVVMVKGGGGYKAIQLARQHEIDSERYVERLRSSLEQFISAIGVDWETIIGGVDLRKFGAITSR
ncbi:MAG: DNA-directed DNA polymerase I [Desulfurococcaceae archaeon]|nr:DNA-directed DNA polymerase I [Desulfurococcaceae archaeon]